MERRMITIGIAAVLLLASFGMTALTAGGEETAAHSDPTEVVYDLQEPLDQGEVPDLSGALQLSDVSFEGVVFSSVKDEMLTEQKVISGLTTLNSNYYSLDTPTRASDAENEIDQHDFPNGSKLTSADETIAGTLTYDPDTGGSPDWRDWYKFSVDDINELANTVDGVRNITVSLVSYTDENDGYTGLYEYGDDGSSMNEEFADVLDINLKYYDPWAGYTDMGNSEFWFDDQDDTDGWTWDENWTTNFVTPVNSDGDEDPDGFANGHTEVGWYYVGIGLNFYIRDQTWSRNAFTVKYSLRIDTTTQEDTDQGSNAREGAQIYGGSEPKHLHSRWNQVDWYKMEGSDPAKIWNISFTVDRQAASAGWWRENDYLDNWLWTFVVWRNSGDDGEWGTEDDGWTYDYLILAFAIDGGRFVSNMEQNLSFRYRNWDTDNPEREVYLGIIMDPVMIRIENDEIIGYYYYSPTYLWNNYTVDINIVEEIPNHAPTLSDLEISSDWEGHPTGGHYETEFTFNITYTDEDNDPPRDVNLVFNPYTMDETIIDMKLHEVDSGDTDYTDGKDYSYVTTGEDLDEEFSPHIIMVNASDTIPVESIRFKGYTGDLYYNDTLYVWNDDPVYLNPGYDGEERTDEDVGYWFPLEENVGLIMDPEQDFLGFQVWNGTAGEWKTDHDSDLLHIEVENRPGDGWVAVVTPKPDMNGEETVTFRGFDEHSNITGDILLIINPVNDPPIVRSVEIDGTTYEVDNTRPDAPEIHLENQIEVIQDSELVIEINTDDIDNEDSEITYSYVETNEGDWKGPIDVDSETGVITLTPNNDDIKKDNSEIVVEIDDGGLDSVRLTIYLKLKNKNDPPTISLPPINTVYEKDEKITITAIFSDPDPGETLTVSINMQDELDGVDAIVDQIPNADFVKDLDWTFNENIGRFTLDLDDWMIWKGQYGFTPMVNITIVFQVKDSAGLTSTVSIDLTLKSDPIPPPDDIPTPTYSVEDQDLDDPGIQGLTVDFEVTGEVTDVFGAVFEPRWEYNGEVISSKEEFEHTFDSDGLKIVYLYYEKDNVKTEKRSISFTLKDVTPPPPPPKPKNETNSWIIPVVIIIIVIIVIILIAAILIVMRKKKEQQAAGQEYYDDQHHLGGRGGAPGLGAHPQTRGLSPARETEHTEKLPPRREAPSGPSCPHCGASIQKGWFLCPECKNPLD